MPDERASSPHSFGCPACGSDLRFDPGSQGLVCRHCGHSEPILPDSATPEQVSLRDFEGGMLASSAMEEVRVAQCSSCGAEIEFDAALHARECPFCASPIVSDTGVQRRLKPQAQLSFLLSEAEARQAMKRWLGRLWFAPSDLLALARADRALTGVYAPYWSYDAETSTSFTGQRGITRVETRHVTVMVNGVRKRQAQQVATTDWTPIRGRVARSFSNILVLGSTSLPKRYADAIEPWDVSVLAPYDPRFIAGFRAEAYSVDVKSAYSEAKAKMHAFIASDVRRKIGGDQQRITGMDTEVGELTFKHVLLPLWLAVFRYRGRSFRFVVNGRTGAVEGERPYSRTKIAMAVLAALVCAIFIVMLVVLGN